MKILHVINRLGIGGAEKLLTELLPVQLQQGHDILVIRLATGNFEFVRRLENSGIRVVSLGRSEKDIYNQNAKKDQKHEQSTDIKIIENIEQIERISRVIKCEEQIEWNIQTCRIEILQINI